MSEYESISVNLLLAVSEGFHRVLLALLIMFYRLSRCGEGVVTGMI